MINVLFDPAGVTREGDAADEARFLTLGMSFVGNLLLVVWTEREGDIIRIISARRASPGDVRHYRGE